MSYHLPKCCVAFRDESGTWKVGHNESRIECTHPKTGGTRGRVDGITPCDRIIGRGETKADAVADAREYLEAQ